jgi:DDE superfamily endonuclease
LHDVVRRAPRAFGLDRTRWTLALLRQTCPDLKTYSPSGVWRLLRRHCIVLKRGRSAVRSPDPAYAAKRAAIAAALHAASASGGREVVLYLDEVTIARQPSVAAAYAPRGRRSQPRAHRSHHADTLTRIVGALDAATGQVHAERGSHIRVATLVRLLTRVVAAYPAGTQFTRICDNWPVHFHPDLWCALAPQRTPFPLPAPPNWPAGPSPDAVRKWGERALPIQLLPLPTYASWLNPIEKLWRWLKQDVVHLHPWAADLPTLRTHLDAFLARFVPGSSGSALLTSGGLASPD